MKNRQGMLKKVLVLSLLLPSCMAINASVDEEVSITKELIKGGACVVTAAVSLVKACETYNEAKKNSEGMFIFGPLFYIKPLAWTLISSGSAFLSLPYLFNALAESSKRATSRDC